MIQLFFLNIREFNGYSLSAIDYPADVNTYIFYNIIAEDYTLKNTTIISKENAKSFVFKANERTRFFPYFKSGLILKSFPNLTMLRILRERLGGGKNFVPSIHIEQKQLNSFKKIEHLEIAANIINISSDLLKGLKRLKSISFYKSNTSGIEIEQLVLNCVNLTKIVFYLTELRVIPDKNLLRKNNIEVLHFDQNKIEHLPTKFFRSLHKIRILSLRGNLIFNLSHDLFNESRDLEKLDLSSNMIEEIPEGVFSYNRHLKELNLESNKIKKINLQFSEMNSLEKLKLRCNYCLTCDENFLGREKIKKSSNDIKNKCSGSLM